MKNIRNIDKDSENPKKIQTGSSLVKTRKKTSDVLNGNIKYLIDQCVSEIAVIKRILENDELNPNEKIISLEHYFQKIIENTSPEVRNIFKNHAAASPLIKGSKKIYRKFFCGENKDILPPHPSYDDYELNKLIKIYNGIVKLKIKNNEIALFKKYPSLIGTEDIDRFYMENVKGTSFEDIFLKVFGSEEEYNEILIGKAMGKKDFDSKQVKFDTNRQIQGLTADCMISKGSYDGFSLNLIVDQETYDRFISKSSNGNSWETSVIHLIKGKRTDENIHQEEKRISGAIKHESTHNIYNAFFQDEYISNENGFNEIILEIINLIKNSYPKDMIEKEYSNLRKEAKNYLASANSEIIADFDRMFKTAEITTAFGSYFSLIDYLLKNIDATKKSSKAMGKNATDELHDVFLDLLRQVIRDYKKIYQSLADFVYIADKEGLKDKLFSLLIIYGIGKCHRIEAYLKEKVGKEKYEFHKIMRALLKPQFFKLPKLDVGSRENELECAIFHYKRTNKEQEIGEIENPLSLANLKKLNSRVIPEEYKDGKYENPLMNGISRYGFKNIIEQNNIDTEEQLDEYLIELARFLKKLKIRKSYIEKILLDISDSFDDMFGDL